MRAVYTIRDYPRLLIEADAHIARTPDPTDTPEIQRQRNLQATETENLRYAAIMKDVRLIEAALTEAVPPDSREAVLQNTLNDKPFPPYKTERTYRNYKQRFIYVIAQKYHFI